MCYTCRCAAKRDLLEGKGNEKKKKSALEVLALAASLIQPREFELPKELQLPITLPGSNKMDYISGRRGKQLSSSYNNGRQKLKSRHVYTFHLSLPPFRKRDKTRNIKYSSSIFISFWRKWRKKEKDLFVGRASVSS